METCLVWTQNKMCLICEEICPYNAIVFRPIERYRQPVVIASRCNSCGYCEQHCPMRSASATVIATDGESRMKEGSYIRKAKKLQFGFKPDSGDEKFVNEESGFKVDKRKREVKNPPVGTLAPQSPKGFLGKGWRPGMAVTETLAKVIVDFCYSDIPGTIRHEAVR